MHLSKQFAVAAGVSAIMLVIPHTVSLAQAPDAALPSPDSTTGSEPKKQEPPKPERPLPPYLLYFWQIKSLQQLRPGVAAKQDLSEAFTQTISHGSTSKEDLQWLLQNASPAGKIYAALLLKRIDPAAGDQAFVVLKSDPTLLEVSKGGEIDHYAVREIVMDYQSENPILNFDPLAGKKAPAATAHPRH